MKKRIERKDGLLTVELTKAFDYESDSHIYIVTYEAHSGHAEDGLYYEGTYTSEEAAQEKINMLLEI